MEAKMHYVFVTNFRVIMILEVSNITRAHLQALKAPFNLNYMSVG